MDYNVISKIFDIDDRKVLFPKEKKAYLTLDRRNCAENRDRTEFSWNFSNDNNVVEGSVCFLDDIRNVTKIKIYDYVLPLNNALYANCSNPLFRPVNVFIKEFSSQSFINNRRFHFVGQAYYERSYAASNSKTINVFHQQNTISRNLTTGVTRHTTYNNNGEFSFALPIPKLESLTLRFSTMNSAIVMPRCKFKAVITSSFAITQNHIYLVATLDDNAEFNAGKYGRLVFENITWDNPLDDELVKFLSRDKGFKITPDTVTTSTATLGFDLFDMEYNTDHIGQSVAGTITADMFIVPYCFTIPLEITYLGD